VDTWQQWYMIAVIVANIVVAINYRTARQRLFGLCWTAMFGYVLYSGGFFSWT
jgi:hypothetical protein